MKVAVITKNEKKSVSAAEAFCLAFGRDECIFPYAGGEADAFVCFGGDGTILRCAKSAALVGAPVVAVNTGRLGFLSSTGSDFDIKEFCRKVRALDFTFESRSMLELNFGGKTYLALNEFFVSRSGAAGARCESVELQLALDGQSAARYVGDGLIIATPTGSTAYSLSAGGPLISPEVKAFVATPVCAHSMGARSVVFSEKSVAQITFLKKRENAFVYSDGRFVCEIDGSEKLTVKKSDFSASIAAGAGFFEKLNKKMQLKTGE